MNFLQKLAEQEEWNGGQGPVQSSAPTPEAMRQSPPPAKNKTLMHMLYRTQAEEEEVTAQHDEFINFLRDNPSPSEEDMNAFAELQGLDPDALDERIYALLSSLLKGVGKNNDTPDAEFDADQLAKGIETELEHTEDELVAKMIAKDHLSEIPDYYDRLGNMEDEAGSGDMDPEMDADVDMEDREYHDDEAGMADERRVGAEEEEDMDMGEENMDMDVEMDRDPDDLDDENMEDDLGDEEMDNEEDDVDADEVVRLAKELQSGEIDYEGFLDGLENLTSPEDDMGDDDMGDDEGESDYESGDLEDDEFEVNLGPAEKDEDAKKLTFKESLLRE